MTSPSSPIPLAIDRAFLPSFVEGNQEELWNRPRLNIISVRDLQTTLLTGIHVWFRSFRTADVDATTAFAMSPGSSMQLKDGTHECESEHLKPGPGALAIIADLFNRVRQGEFNGRPQDNWLSDMNIPPP